MKIIPQKRLIDLLDFINLFQDVPEPTHGDGHIIDLAVTRQDDKDCTPGTCTFHDI